MTDSSPKIPASTFALLHSSVAAQVLSSDSWPVYRSQSAKRIASYLSCHDLQDLLNITKVLHDPIWDFHARPKRKRLATFAEVAQYLETYPQVPGLGKKKPSELDFGAKYLCDVWALASKDSKIAARFEVKGSLDNVRSLHKMWSLQTWMKQNKEWFSLVELSTKQKRTSIPPWLNKDEEELRQAEGKAQERLKTIPIIWDIGDAAEIRAQSMKLDRGHDMGCFSSTDVTETELLPDLWTDQRTTLSDRGPYTTTLFFTSKKISSAELRDALWETWSPVMKSWAGAIAEERELELEGMEDPKERQKRMQPREDLAELDARLGKYRSRHPGSRIGLEREGGLRRKRLWESPVDEVVDEEVTDTKRKKG